MGRNRIRNEKINYSEYIVKEILETKKSENRVSLIKEVDHSTNKVLHITSLGKKELCKDIITLINKVYKRASITQYTKSLLMKYQRSILGKIFYLGLQEGKFLVIKNVSNKYPKEAIIKMINDIEVSQHTALDLLSSIKDQELKSFMDGIVSYVYGLSNNN